MPKQKIREEYPEVQQETVTEVTPAEQEHKEIEAITQKQIMMLTTRAKSQKILERASSKVDRVHKGLYEKFNFRIPIEEGSSVAVDNSILDNTKATAKSMAAEVNVDAIIEEAKKHNINLATLREVIAKVEGDKGAYSREELCKTFRSVAKEIKQDLFKLPGKTQ